VGPEGFEPPCNQLRFQLVMSESRYEPSYAESFRIELNPF